jgi:hypothetical protein
MGIEQVKCAKDIEDAYFKEQEQKQIQKLREHASKTGDETYREQHRNHCFRCGTPSLIEVEKGNVKIDICVNENCGAVHLDPGELDAILKDQSVIKNVRSAIFSVFK